MDRRRFVPRAEGLEYREMLSVASGAAVVSTQATTKTTTTTDTNTSLLKKVRIDRLPRYLSQVTPGGRIVPPDLIVSLQASLTEIKGTLSPPPSASLAAFNRQMRSTLSHKAMSVAEAKTLNSLFTNVLLRSKADPGAVGRFGLAMNRLSQLDATSRNAGAQTAGDYALMMQLCMGIGLKWK